MMSWSIPGRSSLNCGKDLSGVWEVADIARNPFDEK